MTTVFVYEDVTARAIDETQSPIASSLLAEGRAMRDAIVADFAAIPGVCVLQDSATASEFCRHVQSADFTLLIAPETRSCLEYLAREVVRLGGKLLGPSPEAIHLTSDKLALARHWESTDVATPRTWPLGEEPGGKRLIVKPRDGAGSQGIFLPPTRLDHGELELIAQEYVEGYSASVAFLLGDSSVLPLVPCQQLLSDDGRFQYLGGRLPIEPTVAGRAIAIATQAIESVPGLRGYVGVDVVLGDDGRDWVIEINPRLTTSYVGLRVHAKFNLAEAMLKVVRVESVPEFEWHQGTLEFTPEGRVSRSPVAPGRRG